MAIPGFADDLRYGLRLIPRRPGLAAGLVGTLALGIGATAAMFGVISSVLLTPLPVKEPSRLAVLWAVERKHPDQVVEVSYGDLTQWQHRSRTFESLAAISSVNLDVALTGDGRPQQIESMLVSEEFFEVLGARAALGRVPTVKDARATGFVGVISHRLWLARYGGDPKIVGRTITANRFTVTILGVMPRDFDFPHNVDFWYPLPYAQLAQDQKIRVYRIIGRLVSGRTEAQARAEMDSIAQALEAEDPASHRGLGVKVESFDRAVYGDSRAALWGLMAAAGLLLAVACGNAANLMLGRALARREEMRLRAALGAGRTRLLRQLITEAVPVALLAGILGLLLARSGTAVLAALAPQDIPRIGQVAIGVRAIAASFAVTLATMVLFALPGALRASRSDLMPRKHARNRLRGAFVIGQVAVSVVLIASAWTLARGMMSRARIDPGFRSDHVLSFRITLSGDARGSQQGRKRFYEEVLSRVRAIPGVQSAGAILLRPLAGIVGWDTTFEVEGQSADDAKANPAANYEAISPDYFRTMRVALTSGRDFNSGDREGSEPVAIVSRGLERRYFTAGGALGRRIRLRPETPWLRIAGVAADVRYREWDAARFDIYIPFQQRAQHRSDFVVRTAQDPSAIAREVERAVAAVDKDQPVSSLATMDEIVRETFALPRFRAALAGVFAGLALLLAAAGLFAVLMQSIAGRRKEIAIRMAIGANSTHIAWLVLRDGVGLAAAGVLIGTAVGLIGLRTDGSALGLTAASVIAIAVVAAAIPASRAAALDPIDTLRDVG